MHLHPLDSIFCIAQPSFLKFLMRLPNELIDFGFVMQQKRMYMFLIQHSCALGTGEDEIEMQEEAEPGVEGDPAEDEVEG